MTGGSWRAEYLALLGKRQTPPADDKPAVSVADAKAAADDERLVLEAIQRRQEQERQAARYETQAKASAYRDAYHDEQAATMEAAA